MFKSYFIAVTFIALMCMVSFADPSRFQLFSLTQHRDNSFDFVTVNCLYKIDTYTGKVWIYHEQLRYGLGFVDKRGDPDKYIRKWIPIED